VVLVTRGDFEEEDNVGAGAEAEGEETAGPAGDTVSEPE